MRLCSEIFGNLVRTPGYQFYSFLGVLCFKAILKYCNVWYEEILHISQWSDTGPSWPSCFILCPWGQNWPHPGCHKLEQSEQ